MDFDLAKGTLILERTPNVLRSLLAGLPVEWTHPNEGPDTWSPFEVVGHLIDAEEGLWMDRARIILAQEKRPFAPFDRFGHLQKNAGKSFDELMIRFDELRSRSLEELQARSLTPDQLQLTGQHPDLGRVTLAQLLATWVTHDLSHLTQITRVMAKQYRAAVGPWEAYLSVLRR